VLVVLFKKEKERERHTYRKKSVSFIVFWIDLDIELYERKLLHSKVAILMFGNFILSR